MTAEEYIYKDYKVKITYDEKPENPLDWVEDDVIVTYSSHKYALGNKKVDFEDEDWQREEKELAKTYFVFPVYAYIHSDVLLSLTPFNCPWDSGRSGDIYIKKGSFSLNTEEEARKCAEGYLESFTAYLNGYVYCYSIKFRDELIDSCCGFYDFDELKKDVEKLIDKLEIERIKKEGIPLSLF